MAVTAKFSLSSNRGGEVQLLAFIQRVRACEATNTCQGRTRDRLVCELNGASHVRLADNQALLFESLEVAHHAVWGTCPEFMSNLTNCGAISSVEDFFLQEIKNICLSRSEYHSRFHLRSALAAWVVDGARPILAKWRETKANEVSWRRITDFAPFHLGARHAVDRRLVMRERMKRDSSAG